MKYINHFLDFFLPRFCVACTSKLNYLESYFCTECLANIKLVDDKRIENEFNRKFFEDKIISNFYSLFVFEKDKAFQHAIHSIKYNENFKLGIFLGKLVGEKLIGFHSDWKGDVLIPVPLHHIKKAERGFNQSYYIAKGISKCTSIPIKQNVLKRNRHTPSQTELNLKDRKENMFAAFSIKNSELIKNKNVLLIDDVITTGSTVSECGKIIIEAGASKVYAVSIAIADL